jgi:hypothetical protein
VGEIGSMEETLVAELVDLKIDDGFRKVYAQYLVL